MKALILTSQPTQGASLKESFALSGFEARIEDSALYAMTLLERNHPDVIVSAPTLSDLSGLEFFELVRSDPQLALVPFILLSDTPPAQTGEFDLVLPTHTPAAEVVRSAYRLILELTRKTHGAEASNAGIQGYLGDMNIFELAQWLAKSAKTGRLRLDIGGERATWLFSKGQLSTLSTAKKPGKTRSCTCF